mmetsp:Transcript_9364/g.24893  ORF Transcript_9364/g.24893 Transcript_9364/m.24893 type:complete len:272 (+) Transcript_9364:79-894(+)
MASLPAAGCGGNTGRRARQALRRAARSSSSSAGISSWAPSAVVYVMCRCCGGGSSGPAPPALLACAGGVESPPLRLPGSPCSVPHAVLQLLAATLPLGWPLAAATAAAGLRPWKAGSLLDLWRPQLPPPGNVGCCGGLAASGGRPAAPATGGSCGGRAEELDGVPPSERCTLVLLLVEPVGGRSMSSGMSPRLASSSCAYACWWRIWLRCSRAMSSASSRSMSSTCVCKCRCCSSSRASLSCSRPWRRPLLLSSDLARLSSAAISAPRTRS